MQVPSSPGQAHVSPSPVTSHVPPCPALQPLPTYSPAHSVCVAHFANKPVLRSSDTISPEGLPWHHTCCYWNGANPTQHSPCCLSRTTAYGIITLFPCPSHPFNYKSLSLWGSSASWTCLVCWKALSEHLENELGTGLLNFSHHFILWLPTEYKPLCLFSMSPGVHPIILSPSIPGMHLPQEDNLRDIPDPHPPHSHL